MGNRYEDEEITYDELFEDYPVDRTTVAQIINNVGSKG